jgi:hypothetical protein
VASGEHRPGAQSHRFRRREVALTEGGKLLLKPDGSISQIDAEGNASATWLRGDPDWARHAIRFGIQPQNETVVPPGLRERAAKVI